MTQIPVWVFAVLATLVYFGLRQTRTRVVAPNTVSIVACAMLGLSLYGVAAAFGARPAPLLAWASGIAISASLGRRLVGPHGLAHVSSAVRIPGSWWPMGLMLGIFAAKFVLGYASALRPAVVSQPAFFMTASFTFGLLSGAFAGRALVVRAFVRRAGVAVAA